ncbi:NAD(P)H-binding protein [Actinomadura coerulea]|uniref:NAD(P)H-binding protein n=1 Tax=Actinomadura coerulea TaxID=46159 RepID=UPI0034306023
MILVTGATGTIGRPLIGKLTAEGAAVRAVSRRPQDVSKFAGVEAVRGDRSRPETFTPLLDGVTALFLHPRATGEAAAGLLALAKERGVGRVVVLSAVNVDDDFSEQPSRFLGDRNKEVEQAAIESGLDWVSLRSSTFAANTLMTWAPQVRGGDVVRGPYATFAEPLIHERDVAEVAAHALLNTGLDGTKVRLTGPELLSHDDLASIIGQAIGRTIEYQEVPPEVYKQGLMQRGLPEPFLDALLARYARGVGSAETVSGEVERILGRPARTYGDWAADYADTFMN